MIAHTPINTATAGAASLGAAVTLQCPNPAYNCPEVGASTTAVAGLLHGATNPNSNANNAMGQHPRGGSNGGVGPTAPPSTVVVDFFGTQVCPPASIAPQGRAAAAVTEAFEAAFSSPARGGNTDGGDEMADRAHVAQTVAGG